jgi:hypothetical protein
VCRPACTRLRPLTNRQSSSSWVSTVGNCLVLAYGTALASRVAASLLSVVLHVQCLLTYSWLEWAYDSPGGVVLAAVDVRLSLSSCVTLLDSV